MTSDVASAEKLASLRAFAGKGVPDARLRAALVRAGGDLNLAASALLEDGSLGQQDAPILVAAQSQSNVQSQTAPRPDNTEKVEQQERAPQQPQQPQQLSATEVRRSAWRRFYQQNYLAAIAAVGRDKPAIDKFITNLWKSVGSEKRQEYSKAVREEFAAKQREQEKASISALPVDKAQNQAKNETVEKVSSDSSPVTPVNAAAVDQKPEEPQKAVAKPTQSNGGDFGPLPRTPPRKRMRFEPAGDSGNSNFEKSSVAEKQVEKENGKDESWPRKIGSRLCRGHLVVKGGKKKLLVNDEVILEVPPLPPPAIEKGQGKGKRGSSRSHQPSKIVRFSKQGREIGRLAPDVSPALAPALQSGFVTTKCKVIVSPPAMKMFAEVFLDVTIMLTKEAFGGKGEQQAAEQGLSTTGNSGKVENGSSGDQGVDARRVSVVNLITTLKLCQPPDKPSVALPVPTSQGEDAGSIKEEDAEAYYRTVSDIDRSDATSFTPPKNLTCTLREYQRAGVGWMVSRELYGSLVQPKDPSTVDAMLDPLWKRRIFPDGGVFFMNPTTGGLSLDAPVANKGGPYGGILADEMGLGKTVQCIACIVHDMESQLSSGDDVLSAEHRKFLTASKGGSKVEIEGQTVNVALTDNEVTEIMDVDKEDEIRPVCIGPKRKLKSMSGRSGENVSDAESVLAPRRSRRKLLAKRDKLDGEEGDDDDDEKTMSDEEDGDWAEKHKLKDGQDEDEDSDDAMFESPRKRKRSKAKTVKKASAFEKLMLAANAANGDVGGTLIVCPTSLVTQWINELGLHVSPSFLRAVTHYGQSRGNASSISLRNADVVVTTYGILASEFPDDSGDSDSADSSSSGGPLFQLNWRRIILDEAHQIKSRVTKWARAAFRLKAERRWCVTGTVIHNHVNDVFSLIHFLQVKPWSSWAFWNRGVVANIESQDLAAQQMAMSLLRDIISSMTLRRKKSTRDSQGNCIVQLPKKTVEIVRLMPSDEERDFYLSLQEKSKVQFDTYVRQGKVMNNYASVFELLLRLRQACDHPYLVFAAAPSKDSVIMKDKDKLFRRFLDAGSSSQFVEKVLNDAQSGTLQASMTCPLCLDSIEDAVAPKECGHPACRSCLMESLLHAQKCPVCRITISADNVTTLPRATRFSVDLDKKWRSSAKIDALLEDARAIEARRKRNGAVGKMVVFSQFTSMLDLVGVALTRSKMKTLRIDGSVAQAQRAAILQQFETEDELESGAANILLVSLRAGGVGLNLVAAAHAILLDIHWNPQMDAQAQDRVHRHGQIRDVVVKRYIVKDSVEERLLQVQSRKRAMADGALGVATEEDRKQAKLSELKLLFGSS